MIPHPTPIDQLPQLLTARRVAELLGVSERTIWNRTAPRGALRACHIGRLVRYTWSDVQQYIELSKEPTR